MLAESKKTAESLQKQLSALDKEKYKEQIKSSNEIVKAIDEQMALYLGKVDKRQGITRNPEMNVVRRLGTASGYIGSRQQGITETERRLMKFAKEAVDKALNSTRSFYNEKWPVYRESIEALNINPFTKLKKFTW